MFGLAILSYHLVEQPLRHRSWAPYRYLTIAVGLAVASLGALTLRAMGTVWRGALYSGKPMSAELQASAILRNAAAGVWQKPLQVISERVERCNLTPEQLENADGVSRSDVAAQTSTSCLPLTRLNRKPILLLIGDSFTHSTAKHVGLAAVQSGYEFRVLYGYGCPFPLRSADLGGQEGKSCPVHDESLFKKRVLDSLIPGDILVVRLAFQRSKYVEYPRQSLPPSDVYDVAIRRLAESVKARGARLKLIGANPVLTLDELSASNPQWFNSLKAEVSEGRRVGSGNLLKKVGDPQTRYYLSLDRHFESLSLSSGDFDYLPTRKIYCFNDESCYILKDGRPLYFDNSHLSSHGNDLMFNSFLSLFKKD